jgi:hypothetical protein
MGHAQPTAQPQRKGRKVGVVTEWTIIAPVIAGKEQELRDKIPVLLRNAQAFDAIIDVGLVHEFRWVILDDYKRIMFCSSFDGTWDDYIDDFFAAGVGNMFDAVFSHCVGYPGSKDPHVRDWYMQYTVEAAYYASSYPEATTRDILRALALQKTFQQVLDNPAAEQAMQDPALKPLLDQAAN